MSPQRRWKRLKSLLRGETVDAAKKIAEKANSHTPASDNSQASTEAIAELTTGLDFVFENLESEVDHDHGDILEAHLERLLDEAAKYQNSRVDEDSGQAWSCSQNEANLVHSACCCSSDVYKNESKNTAELCLIVAKKPSLSGTRKAFSIWKSPKDQALIVALRGSSVPIDHMVNLSHTAGNTPSILKLDSADLTVRAHSGYLSCADALFPDLEKEISQQITKKDPIKRVVFTGHSAGGAVASLLFIRFANRPTLFPTSKLSLITFGSPPVTSENITSLVKELPQTELILSFVNELDMVTRADEAYIRSLVNLYRSRYNLPPVGHSNEEPAEPNPFLSLSGEWPLPPPSLYQTGDILLLKESLLLPISESDSEINSISFFEEASGCVELSSLEFGRLLFCDIKAHKRSNYLERIKALRRSYTLRDKS